MFNMFKKQKKDNMVVRIEVRSSVIQYDTRGYPLRPCIDNQMWIDNGDVVLKWKY